MQQNRDGAYHEGMKRVALALISILVCLPVGAQKMRRDPAVRYASRGLHGAVATGSEYAASAAMRILYAGGTAVDAGVAATFAASVTEISHFGFGGEAPILVRLKDGRVKAIAGVGTMPKLATADFYRKHALEPGEVGFLEENGMTPFVPVYGILSALVPGMVEANLVTLKEFGTMSFEQAITPALENADGFPLDDMRASSLRWSQRYTALWPDSKRVFDSGRQWRPGEIFRQPDLARTLRSMIDAERKARVAGKSRAQAIDAVRDYFYRGDVAHKIDAYSKANGGLLRYEDLAAFHVEPEDAPSANYRGYTVYKGGFWGQGPAMLEALNILEGFDLRGLGFNSPEYLHKVVEALKLAYADRDTYYGDPRFNQIPTQQLLSQEYGAGRRGLISDQASQQFQPGQFPGVVARHPSQYPVAKVKIDDVLAAKDTTCVDVIDKDGNMFSATPSGAWLPSVIAGDTGIALTERAQSFLLIDGHPNVLAGGKRPRVTLSPTLVTKDGKPAMVLSTPGGDNQDQALLQLFLDVVEFNMNAETAVEAPRFQTRHLVSSFDNHAMSPGDLLLDDRIPDDVLQAMAKKGHKVEQRNKWNSGAAPVIIRVLENGVMEAGADPFGYRYAFAW